jgi:hypothetical protein
MLGFESNNVVFAWQTAQRALIRLQYIIIKSQTPIEWNCCRQ